MLECIKFGDCKIKTIQKEDKWFESVRHIGIALGVSFDILKWHSTRSFVSAV